MKKILSFLVLMCVSLSAMASETSVLNAEEVEIWYDFDSSTNTASVTYKGSKYYSYDKEYTGEVVIPSTVTYKGVEYSVTAIGEDAFYNCSYLTSITIPEGVTSIGDYAFEYCSALTSITLPEGVTKIGEDAFSGCSSLTSITLPEGVTSIGDDAFCECDALTSITIPEGVTKIGGYAFEYCTALTSITLPKSLTEIGDYAFDNCYKLYEVYNKSNLTITAGSWNNGYVAYYAKNVYTDSEGESKLKTVGDYIFYVDSEDIELIAYTGSETSITLPSDYEGKNYNIGGYAFSDCDALTSITIPEGVTSIGDYAFRNCFALTSITIPEGVTSIGNSAFYECDALTSITIPEGVTSIGEDAFSGCSSLTSITLPEGVTSIGDYAFYNCDALTSITLPESLTEIGDFAFKYCYRLYEVYNKSDLTITAGSTDNGYVAYYAKNVYTDSEGESKLKTVGDYIFYADGEDIELIAYTGGKTSITLPSDYEGKNYKIGYRAFYECDALTSITIPEGVTSIGDDAFSECDALTSITIPEGVTSIGKDAFSGCSSLTSITIPEGVTSIGEWTFGYCYSLTSITLPEGVTSIGNYAFYDCYSLTSITLPKDLTSIGNYAFYDCNSLTSITLPEGVTSIGDDAFNNCYKLYEVYNKSDLTITAGSTDNGYVAYYAKNVYSEGESKLKTVGDYLFYVDGEDIELIAYTGSETSITLPSDYEGKNYNIGGYAFSDCDALTSITIPEGVTKIGNYAFYKCDALTSITIPEGVTEIGDYAFCYCEALTSITLPETVTSIGEEAFYDCFKLYEVYNKSDLTITAGSTDNGRVAYYAKNVYSVGESKLKTVGDYLFYADGEDIELIAYTGSETSITLPSGYEGKNYNIGDYAFYECDALTSITLPEGVTSIGERTFAYCSALTSIISKNATPPTIGGSDTFYDVDKSIPVYVPKSSVDAYKSAAHWKYFTNIVGAYFVDVIAENGTVEGAGAYEENAEATLTATPAEGYKFVQWSDGVTDNPRTMTITKDVSLEAIFEKETSTAIENDNVDAVSVRLIGNRVVVVEGADDYTVYSISGQNLGKVESVERGIYIVVVNGKSFKVVAK